MSLETLEKQEQGPTPLHIDDPDIISIIAQIEGSEWQGRQELEFKKKEGEDIGSYSVLVAKKHIEGFRNRLTSLRQELKIEEEHTEIEDLKEEIIEIESGHGSKAEIYGAGGVNRYFVLSNGNVVISESHLSGLNKKDKLEKAKQLGINSI